MEGELECELSLEPLGRYLLCCLSRDSGADVIGLQYIDDPFGGGGVEKA
jgi:hypothetical protein